jgi:serine/threonine protein phosphatase PrpC
VTIANSRAEPSQDISRAVEKSTFQWQIIGQSVRGAAHERRGMPNQDAIAWRPRSGKGSPLAVALSDGHGSTRYPRSHIGAHLAVRTATQLIHSFAVRHKQGTSLSIIKRTAEEWLPQAIARAWLDAVREHLDRSALSTAESAALLSSDQNSSGADQANPAIAYGATLVAVAVTNAFVIYLQIGDGDILTVTANSEVQRPLPEDNRLIANETTSLCAVDAWRDFRVAFQPINNSRPELILLATDGYPNSFKDETGFKQAGVDILKALKSEGGSRVASSLEGWLKDTTKVGSGDDVTLGILYPTRAQLQKQKPGGRPHKSESSQR